MFRLKLPTDPRWANVAESNLEEILTDHAWCEQKAATNAITLITLLPEYPEIVTELLAIAQEELDHFNQVHEIIKARGYVLGRSRKDDYVNDLFKFIVQGSREDLIVDKMLFAAMIEARSCERFKVLTENIKDEELKVFYNDLMISEANHYTTFIKFARQLGDPEKVNQRWEEWLEYEAKIIRSYGKKETIHG
ncbi:tRNA-(ms[2]io[6]A)-hydroxylase [Elizabethkingia meningoseptica]|uniref:tRNA 2-methylthio-N6-isopentenyl adenosine(37) hydroxylase MiaE n=1 Tax=Elizabethkingia meningoseptica TaxID=238 RepID=A0A1V3TWN6_ELIME|nr:MULTISPECIES: tRNA-(ms[2]io[6]A)-hydroxylase [Elizabethkingia]AQX04308.1 tRNA 2-methylthio-N6-isopentenyl adenosine(37) hydroxylase MiaE [Elizabethkingia meningoseptica]AQX11775.1 tRNA 2-methylthio-N6-isopentenyl adenosine(37) hydroxylase MiaE [Elizabethkingia meningoseptica]AQX46350.1 tRNA hydroxylase [Elizabethkingia meningoseptica]EJK5330694.1 tRNA-(ms[2]io[6]A)-hydroxylase [Elizabethkingia meningoseptica]EOR29996.1 tRNA (ms[2]io[6]A)-hydroxylase [Elizabethkingia meningoseptica ATCC 1325